MRRSTLIPALTAIAACAVPAAASAATYSASIAQAPEGKLIARDVLWTCAAGACSGATDYSRPLIICQSLARKAGRVDSFRVNGRALAAAELERCNAAASGAATSASGTN